MKSISREWEWRKLVAGKIIEWGNAVFLGTVLIQIFPKEELNIPALIVGIIVFFAAYYFAHHILMGGGKK